MQKLKNDRQKPTWSGRKFILKHPYMTGDDIAAWQDMAGGLVVDGWYESEDAERAKRIQALNGLVVDGIVGPKTWDATFNKKKEK